ncbi:MAG: AraC family transcriptional regulator [Enhydrobacter sp.]|nr:MAG: AraC family transcriptional regulator [Enhydrobacter sp.]
MTGTPDSFADTPDVLAEMLRAVRLTGAVFFNATFSAPFGVLSPRRFDPGLPMAHLRHISVFHMVVSGGCTFEAASGRRRGVTAGDLLLIPFADQHKFWNGDGVDMAPVPSFLQPGPIEGMWAARHGGGGEQTRMLCGFLESSEFLGMPLFRGLPELLVARVGDGKIGELMASTVRQVMALVEQGSPGAQNMLGRMMELLFVEMLRRYAAGLPEGSKGWLAALNDPVVGRALRRVHTEPARKWTADSLAREAGSSRTVLAERFNALLGQPPIEYVTVWRIQLAAERLRNGRDSVAAIADDVGYESEAAFARAFKRVTGLTPGQWRSGAGDSPELMPLQFRRPLIPDPA